MKNLQPEKIFILNAPWDIKTYNTESDRYRFIIGYHGVGQAVVPQNVILQLMRGRKKYTYADLLKLCIEESQVVPFEEIK